MLFSAGATAPLLAAAHSGGASPLWTIGVGALVGIGGGLLISLNRRRGK